MKLQVIHIFVYEYKYFNFIIQIINTYVTLFTIYMVYVYKKSIVLIILKN